MHPLSFLQAHPQYWPLLWPLATGMLSFVYGKLEAWPRAHGLASALVAAGLDVPEVVLMLKQAVTGKVAP